jgi:hypothetical protein
MRLDRTPLIAGLLALTFFAHPSLTHAQTTHSGLSARDRAIFVPVLPSVQRCSADLSTVTTDLQQASDNMSAGSMDMGSLRSDALQMRNDCLSAAARVTRLRIPAGATHALARRVKNELHAALVDFAQGAYDCTRLVDALGAGDGGTASAMARQGVSAWDAANAHLRVATGYVR